MANLLFSWQDTSNELSRTEYNLYEDGEKIVSNIEVLNFSLLMDGKEYKVYDYYVTAVDKITKLESAPSETLSVNFILPEAPTGLSASFE